MKPEITKHDVGELRPSQILTTFGVGSIVDLPNIAAMVMGLDDWPTHYSSEISEERLLSSVQKVVGSQVKRLLTPPRAEETGGTPNVFDERAFVGVPVAPFPRWMVCPSCQLLAPLSSGLFSLKTDPYRPERARYIHTNCTKSGRTPTVVPARFVIACPHGHLDDFPWVEFVHRGTTDCRYRLRLTEGISGEAADVIVTCEVCSKSQSMALAFGPGSEENLPVCRGRRPHLRDYDPQGCDVEHVRAMLQGASNSWFPVILSALNLPTSGDPLAQLVADHWATLDKTQSRQNVELLRQVGQLNDFSRFTDQQVWDAVLAKRAGTDAAAEPTDLKFPEWEMFSNPTRLAASGALKLHPVEPPEGYRDIFDKIVLVERLREVRALIGFTRIESPGDYDTPFEVPEGKLAPLSRSEPKWIPANEVNGEGIFFQFAESLLASWEQQHGEYDRSFFEAHQRWREARNHPQPKSGYPSLRFVLLHSFAHAVIRQLAVECGYTAASIRERIYSRTSDEGSPMAGVLIYTAAPDSEGTLGGLVSLGATDTLGRHLDQALEAMRLCASDPLCAEHRPHRDATLHVAACHACLFLPETSCERGNKYLDRSVLVRTLDVDDVAYFRRDDG